jgi:predicted GNAT family N-acyltransferase
VNPDGPFRLEHGEGGTCAPDLLALRAVALADLDPGLRQWDALDALSRHLLARDPDGRLIGAGRLAPDRRIGRLAVAPQWRGRGIGRAMVAALLETARQWHWPEVTARPVPDGRSLFASAGFLPLDDPEREPGLLHRRLDGPMAVEDLAGAIDSATALITPLRRELLIYSRALDPGLLDADPVQAALRRFATLRHARQVRCLLQETTRAQMLDTPLLRLAQRLPSVFEFRLVSDPVDTSYPSAYLVGDGDAYYFRPTGNRYDDGEVWLEGAARARQLRAHFAQIWERSEPWSGHRALGI